VADTLNNRIEVFQAASSANVKAAFAGKNSEIQTPTPNPSSTITPTPGLAAAEAVLAPVPVSSGRPLCLLTGTTVQSAGLKIYNLMGEKIADVSFQGPGSHCWNTQGTAPGLYIVDVTLTYADGSTAYTRKKILITP